MVRSSTENLAKAASGLPLLRHRRGQRFVGYLLIIATILLQITPTTLYAAAQTVNWPLITLHPVASGFASPVNLISAHDGTNRLFLVERGGVIYIIENGVRVEPPFLNIADRVTDITACSECGLLGVAFPPDFAESGYFLVNYTSNTNQVPGDTDDPDGSADTVIARFFVSDNPNVADVNSFDPILRINQPVTNHNGGHMLFGPDGHLYIGMGDGGGNSDTFQNAQNPASLHGKILRTSVGATGPYTIPADNPFVNLQEYRDEIWLTGLRNPWRFTFDRATGDLYIADVGQGDIEEINHIAAAALGSGGMNFGWPILEGNNCYPPNTEDCDRTGMTAPVATYDHSLGDCSVTGGDVLNSNLPNQAPIYLYGDYCSGRMWGLQRDGAAWATRELSDLDEQITSFGKAENGSVYLVSYSGTVYQLREPENRNYLPGIQKPE